MGDDHLTTRLKDLVHRFRKGEVLTSIQLSDEYGVDIRTIQRDLSSLRKSGFLVDDHTRTYRVNPKYRMDDDAIRKI